MFVLSGLGVVVMRGIPVSMFKTVVRGSNGLHMEIKKRGRLERSY